MATARKTKVDYFPHYCSSGKTIFILEAQFGNDGYAFWFKLLELLCESDNQFFDCSETCNWRFLLARMKIVETKAKEIIDALVLLGAIDKKLWEEKQIIWSDNLVKNLGYLYSRRSSKAPVKPGEENETCNKIPDSVGSLLQNTRLSGEFVAKNEQNTRLSGEICNIFPQSKVKESKVNTSTPSIPLSDSGKGEVDGEIFIKSQELLLAQIPDESKSKLEDFKRLTSDFTELTATKVVLDWLADKSERKEPWYRLLQKLQAMEQHGEIHPMSYVEWQRQLFFRNITAEDGAKIRDIVKSSTSLQTRLDKLIEDCQKPDTQIKYPARYVVSELQRL